MSTRMRMFFWEQRRLLSWVLGATGFSMMGSIIASISLAVPDSHEAASAAGWFGKMLHWTLTRISDKDAVELADGYAMIALLLMLFGALVPNSTKVQIDLPNRLLRLPLGSMRLAWAWVASRVVVVAAGMLLVLAVRHAFLNLPSTLIFLPAFCYYLGGFLLFQGVARIVSAWREQAAVVVIVVLAAVLGFLEKPLWELTLTSPFIPLLLGALIGLPLAVGGILLRRRGGIGLGLDAQGLLGRGAEYRSVADIPAFSSPLEAHTWFEQKRFGWHFPVLCLVGVFVVMGAALYNLIDKDEMYGLTRINVKQIVFSFLSAPLVGAVFMALQFAGRDAGFASKSRFVHVRPLSGMLFVRARGRMLVGSVGWGMVCIVLGIFVTFGVGIFALGAPASASEAYARPSLALNTVFSATDGFLEKYSSRYDLQDATGVDNLLLFLRYGVVLAALLMFANRYVLIAFGTISFVPILGTTLAPLLLLGLTLWGTMRSGALSAHGATKVALTWLGLWVLSLMWMGTYFFSNTPVMVVMAIPLGGALAVALCGPLAMALAFDAKRSASWFPPRRTGARAHWGEARGLFVAVGVVAGLVLVGTLGWRATVKSGVTDQLRLANELGVGPRSTPVAGPEDAWVLSRWDVSGIVAAQQGIGVKFGVESRRFECDAMRATSAGPLELVVPTDGADLAAEESVWLENYRPDLERAGTAAQVLLNRPTGPATLSAPPMLEALRDAAAQCGLLALLGAEQRDPDLAFLGLSGGALLLRGLHAEPTLDMTLLRADIWRSYAIVLERVLNRVALRPEQVCELLQILPTGTSPGHIRNMLRVAPQSTFWGSNYESKPYGFRGHYGTQELFLQGLEEVLLLPAAAYGKAVDAACEVAVQHDDCLRGRVGATRIDNRRHWDGLRDWRGVLTTLTSHTHAKIVASHEQVHLGDAALGLCRAALLLEEYRLAHGNYPENIEALAPAEREAFPKDWSNRGNLEAVAFRRTGHGAVRIHVAWINQVDDGGAGDDLLLEINRP